MMVNGVWVDNITCPRCSHRHPRLMACSEAARLAHEEAQQRETVDREHPGEPTLEERVLQLERTVAELRSELSGVPDFMKGGAA